MVGIGSKNLTPKTISMEDAYGILFVLERFVPTIEWKDSETDEYDKHRMGYS